MTENQLTVDDRVTAALTPQERRRSLLAVAVGSPANAIAIH